MEEAALKRALPKLGCLQLRLMKLNCISQWGLSKSKQTSLPFRVWYGNLAEINSLISNRVPSIVLATTASKATKKDIFTTLNLDQETFVIKRIPEWQNIWVQ